MTTKDLEQAILDLFEEIYQAKYTAGIKVKELMTWDGNHRGYELILDLNNKEKPLTIAYEGDFKTFLKFLNKELRFMALNRTKYYFGQKFNCKEDDRCN
jgi:hypothetical protein